MSRPGEPTKELIEEVIRTCDTSSLIGLIETGWFEVRERSYLTTRQEISAKQKYELAKDCSSIANSGGGYIFIGIKTIIDDGQMSEHITEVPGISREDVQLTSWRDTLLEWLSPRFTLENMEHGEIELLEGKVLFWIKIPSAQETGVFPIIVTKDQYQEGEASKIRGRVVGLYQRHGAENDTFSPERIQNLLSIGIAHDQSQGVEAQLNLLKTKMDTLLNRKTRLVVAKDHEKRADELLQTTLHLLEYGDSGYFYIYASPKNTHKIANFLSSEPYEGSLPYLLKHPPQIRRMGFDLSVAIEEQPIVDGESWRISNGSRKHLLVTEECEILSLVSINRFIDWGLEERAQQDHVYNSLINEYAMTEYIAMFCRLVQQIATRESIDEETFVFRFGFGGANEGAVIGLNQPNLSGIFSNGTAGPINVKEWTIEAEGIQTPDQISAQIMLRIARQGFGYQGEMIYLRPEGDGSFTFDQSSYKRS